MPSADRNRLSCGMETTTMTKRIARATRGETKVHNDPLVVQRDGRKEAVGRERRRSYTVRGRSAGGREESQCSDAHSDDLYVGRLSPFPTPKSLSLSLVHPRVFTSYFTCYIGTNGLLRCNARTSHAHTWIIAFLFLYLSPSGSHPLSPFTPAER